MRLRAQHRQPWSRPLCWATLIGLELGLIGPFGSYAASPLTRVCYWLGLCWTGTLVLWPSLRAAMERARARGRPVLVSGGVALLAGCVPVAGVAATACAAFWPVHASGMPAAEWYASTLLVAMPAMAALAWFERPHLPPPASAPAAPAPGTAPPGGVPAHQLALALCLQMEDHHVRIHLPGGSRLHLASLKATIGRMDATRGMQVHRSWWVARDAVRAVFTEERSVGLLLVNGVRVPVARNRVGHLREQGWLGIGDGAGRGAA